LWGKKKKWWWCVCVSVCEEGSMCEGARGEKARREAPPPTSLTLLTMGSSLIGPSAATTAAYASAGARRTGALSEGDGAGGAVPAAVGAAVAVMCPPTPSLPGPPPSPKAVAMVAARVLLVDLVRRRLGG
jgi:hypothetical protein